MAAQTEVKAPAPGSARPGGFEGFGEYLRGVRTELKKAEWPSRPELIRLTQVTLIIITVVAVYCGGLDFLLGLITNRLFNR
ncbi:MAG: preprotein translocase subunit SecE [Capsulimonadales bacterium]|nr:preprotein translocase subunit SecE [Capsulimonadales bacterium]